MEHPLFEEPCGRYRDITRDIGHPLLEPMLGFANEQVGLECAACLGHSMMIPNWERLSRHRRRVWIFGDSLYTIIIIVLLALSNIANADIIYADKRDDYTVTVPTGWSIERFTIGATLAQFQSRIDDDIFAFLAVNCNTVLFRENSINNIYLKDRKINEKPFTNRELDEIINLMETGMGIKINTIMPTSLQIGNQKNRAVEYRGHVDFPTNSGKLYMHALYIPHYRLKGLFGVTCAGGGESPMGAQASFEYYSNDISKLLRSFEFGSK